MPTTIINTLATFKKYVRVVFTSTDINGLPNMERADRKYLIPVLGDTVYAALVINISNQQWATLLDICRCYVAPMAMLAELATRNIQITDSGIKKTTSADMDNIFKWEYNELKDSLENQAAEALDELWRHLIEHGANYNWVNPESDTAVIKSAKEFKKYYPTIQHFYRIYPALHPIILAVQDHYISDAIGTSFLKILSTIPEPSSVELEALELLKKGVVYLTIMQATEQLPVKLTTNGFTVLLSNNSDSVATGDISAGATTLSALRSSCEATGIRYIQQLKMHLNKYASAELFTEYFTSEKYTAPGTVTNSPNKSRIGVFGL